MLMFLVKSSIHLKVVRSISQNVVYFHTSLFTEGAGLASRVREEYFWSVTVSGNDLV